MTFNQRWPFSHWSNADKWWHKLTRPLWRYCYGMVPVKFPRPAQNESPSLLFLLTILPCKRFGSHKRVKELKWKKASKWQNQGLHKTDVSESKACALTAESAWSSWSGMQYLDLIPKDFMINGWSPWRWHCGLDIRREAHAVYWAHTQFSRCPAMCVLALCCRWGNKLW